MSTKQPIMINILLAHSLISLTHAFLVSVVKSTIYTYHANIGVKIVAMLDLDTSTLPKLCKDDVEPWCMHASSAKW